MKKLEKLTGVCSLLLNPKFNAFFAVYFPY